MHRLLVVMSVLQQSIQLLVSHDSLCFTWQSGTTLLITVTPIFIPWRAHLSQPTPAMSASSSTPSRIVNYSLHTHPTQAPLINPSTGSESSNPEPTSSPLNASISQEGSHLLARSCYESDSESESEDHVSLCELHADNWCFSTWRQSNNGMVHFRWECANSCEPVTRNQKVKLCCRISLCNVDDTTEQ